MALKKSVARHGDLEINQDIVFQRRMWRAERCTRYFILAALIACVLGFFGGGGWLAEREIRPPARSFVAKLPRFGRVQHRQQLILDISEIPAGEARIGVDAALLENFYVREVFPEPLRTEIRDGAVEFVFAPPSGPWTVRLELQPRRAGALEGRLRLPGGEAVEFRQWIYP